MNSRKKRYLANVYYLGVAKEEMQCSSMLLFLFSNKNAVDLRINKDDERSVLEMIKVASQIILKRKLFILSYKMKKDSGFILSKTKFINPIDSVKTLGLLLSIPSCCVEKYSQEDCGDGWSNNSSRRYIKQLISLRAKKDEFNIKSGIISAYCEYGFIPCNPKCKKALKIIKDINKIKRSLE